MRPREGQIPLEFVELKKSGGEVARAIPAASGAASRDDWRDQGLPRRGEALAKANPAPTGEIEWASLGRFVGFGFLGGLILNLMPCVLPVIGLKVLSFVQQGGQSRGGSSRSISGSRWACSRCFWSWRRRRRLPNLGWGQQFTYTWFKVAMVVIVFAFALSFLGVWEVPIPGFAQSNTSEQAAATRKGRRGVFQRHLHHAAGHALQRAVPGPGVRLHARRSRRWRRTSSSPASASAWPRRIL